MTTGPAYLGNPHDLTAERGICWFCKGEFVVDALIAGYDTWDESRLACLACNERMQGNWRPAYLLGEHDQIWEELAEALHKAMTIHPAMHSPHEGHSVIREEMDELWEHVRADTGRSAGARKEALQIAAMGLRYALDLTDPQEEQP